MSATAQPQTSLYETELNNPELEALLEERQKLKESKSTSEKAYKELNDRVKVKIDDADIADAPVRIGRFVVRKGDVEARVVHFETEPTTRLQIRLLPDD